MKLAGVFAREWRTVVRNRAAVVNPLAFMFLAVMLFAVGSPLEDNARALSGGAVLWLIVCLLYTSPSPRDRTRSRMPSSA